MNTDSYLTSFYPSYLSFDDKPVVIAASTDETFYTNTNNAPSNISNASMPMEAHPAVAEYLKALRQGNKPS